MQPIDSSHVVIVLSLSLSLSLSLRYICLDKEMEEIGKVWKVAKDQLQVHHQEMKRVSEPHHHQH